METPTIRRAEEDDAPALLTLVRQLYAHERMPFDPVRTPAALHALLKDPALGQVWLLETDGEPAGYLVLAFVFVLEFGGRCAFVDELFVAPAHRGKGYGGRALEHAVAIATQIGLAALRLEVDHANPDAERLYRRAGFQRHERYILTRRI